MKKNIVLVIIFILSNILLSSIAVADVKKGQKVYKRKLQKSCKLPGSLFARKHTQDEWEEIMDNNSFKDEVKKICPNFEPKRLNDKQWDYLYDFSYQFGVGGEIPNGCDPK